MQRQPRVVDVDAHGADLGGHVGRVGVAGPASPQAQAVLGHVPAGLGQHEGVLGAQDRGAQATFGDLPSVEGLFEDLFRGEGEGAGRATDVDDLDQLAGDDGAHGAGP